MRRRLGLLLSFLSVGCSPEPPTDPARLKPTEQTTPQVTAPLSPAAAATRAAILDAAAQADWATLDSLASWTPGPDQSPFLYTLGPLFDTPSAFWRAHGGDGFLSEMAAVFSSSPQPSGGTVGWPAWAWTPPSDLSAADRASFEAAVPNPAEVFTEAGDYLGATTAIDSTGRWLYYVAGE